MAEAVGRLAVMVSAWAAAWGLLHAALRGRRPAVMPWFYGLLVALTASTLLAWPPVWRLLGA